MDGAPAAPIPALAGGPVQVASGVDKVELVAVHEPSSLAVPGLHHLAYLVDSFDAAAGELTARGCDDPVRVLG